MNNYRERNSDQRAEAVYGLWIVHDISNYLFGEDMIKSSGVEILRNENVCIPHSRYKRKAQI